MPEKINVPFYAYKGDAPYIFISYSHKDSDKVFPIIKKFNDSGFNIWYDEGIDPGNEWPLEIERALKNSSMFLVFITPNSVKSRNVRNEINYALSNNLPFLAIYLEETELIEGLGLQMGSTQAIMKYRMEEDAFYYKSETVFNQMLSAENHDTIDTESEEATSFTKTKRRASIKKLVVFGGCAGVLITGIAVFLIMIFTGKYIYDENIDMGISLSYPKGWEMIDRMFHITTLHNENTGAEICIIDITEDIVINMAETGNDIITAAEITMYEHSQEVAYYEDMYEYWQSIHLNDNMILEGYGNFLLNLSGDGIYNESVTKIDLTMRQHENRVFIYTLSIPDYYNYTDSLELQEIYTYISESLKIEGNPMSIEERVAEEMTPKG